MRLLLLAALAAAICGSCSHSLPTPASFTRVSVRELAVNTGSDDGDANSHRRYRRQQQTDLNLPGVGVLRLEPNPLLFAADFEARVVSGGGGHEHVDIDTQSFLHGDVVGEPGWSSVGVHRDRESGVLTGHIYTRHKLFLVEPGATYGLDADMIVYDAADAPMPTTPGSCTAHAPTPSAIALNGTADDGHGRRARRAAPSPGNTACLIHAVGDSRFYAFHGSNRATAINAILTSIDYANARFEASDLDGRAYGIAVSRVTLFTDTAQDPFYRGTTTSWSPSALLEKVAEQNAATIAHNNYCLVHLFTSYTLAGGVQGLAYVASSVVSTGGICHGYNTTRSMYYNVGFTTAINNEEPIPTLMRHLVTAHEFGHSFGASHDELSVDPTSCVPDAAGGGKYIMYPISVSGDDGNNDDFSGCSVPEMTSAINAWGACFQGRPLSYCGNGVVEPGGADGDVSTTADNEECDTGIGGDSCCTANCKLINPAGCSDANSACCESCAIAPNTKVCYQEFANDVECKATTYCDGTNSACPTIGQKTAGAACGSLGTCMANADPALRCTPWCARFGATQCTCTDGADECGVCCVNNATVDPYCAPGLTWNAGLGVCRSGDGLATAAGKRPFGATCTAPPA